MEVKLVVVGGRQAGMEIPVPKPKFLIGRGEQCRLRPQSTLVSRKHCAIVIEEGSAAIEDFGSTNGTFVNGEKVQRRRQLKNGDRIKIGMMELEVQLAVSVGGKKKPKVHNVQEAAARTVASAAATDEDLDISGWLDEDNEGQNVASPPEKPTVVDDTTMGKNADDTMTMSVAPGRQGNESEPPVKVVGQFQRTTKPMADSSRSAARDMLKQFLPKKRP